jgi:small-conductance mechanosensitive channel
LLGVESFNEKTTTLRLEGRTMPDRRDDIIREIRQRVRQRFAQDHIELESVQQSSS